MCTSTFSRLNSDPGNRRCTLVSTEPSGFTHRASPTELDLCNITIYTRSFKIYDIWLQASKQASIHMHVRYAVTLVWGSLRLAPTTSVPYHVHLQEAWRPEGLQRPCGQPSPKYTSFLDNLPSKTSKLLLLIVRKHEVMTHMQIFEYTVNEFCSNPMAATTQPLLS